MSKTADGRSSKLTRPESGREAAPAAGGGFAPVSAPRIAAVHPAIKAAPLPAGGETTQYQVPLELLVLARNKEKDKARSVAVTPVAPRPNSDEPPPSSELSGLRGAERAEAAPPAATESTAEPAATQGTAEPVVAESAVVPPTTATTPAPSHRERSPELLPAASPAPSNQARSEAASRPSRDYVTLLGWLVLIALCTCAGYYAVALLLG